MPIAEENTQIFDFPMARRGVNLYSSIIELSPEECLKAQNVIWRNGIVKRGGQKKFSSTEVNASDNIVGLHKYYKSNETSQLIAVSDTDIKHGSGGSWTNIDTGQTADLQTLMVTWGALDKVYIANGIDQPIQWDGTTAINGAETIITILDYADLATNNTVVTVTVDGIATACTEDGVGTPPNWFAQTSNNVTATDLASALNSISGISASATDAVVTVIADAGTGAIESLVSDESDATNITIAHIATPRKVIQFLPYQDRLLCIDKNRPGEITWSGTYDVTTWETRANVGVRPDTQLFGMSYHSSSNVNAGYEAKILLAGANGMYLFSASDLRVPFTTGDYTIYPLATSVGCNAPRTMVWTPHGTMYLGIDRQVYLLPFNSNTPVPISDKIRSNRVEIEGIEQIPKAQTKNACATYHDGFYMLSVTKKNETINSNQWWLDVNRLFQDDNKQWGPWYGPITGQNISAFFVQSGPGDAGELMAGEADASTGSFIYQINDIDSNADVSSDILVNYKTYFNNIGNPYFKKDINETELEFLDTSGDLKIQFHDTTRTFNESSWVCDSSTAKIYNLKMDGSLISSFATSLFDASATSPQDITVSTNGTLWVIDSATKKVYNIETTGTLKSSFATSVFDGSATSPTGISYANDNTLWITDANTDKVYNVSTSGTAISNFATSVFDPGDTLWVADNFNKLIHNLQTDSTPIDTIDITDYGGGNIGGVSEAFDGTLWVTDNFTDTIYNIQIDGTFISSFVVSVFDSDVLAPQGLSEASDGTLWIGVTTSGAASNPDKIYNTRKNGTALSFFLTTTYDSNAGAPLGISEAFDGTLWVTDLATKKIFNIQKDGTLISFFATSTYDVSATQPTGISEASDDTLWVNDDATNKIYNIQKDGTFISSFTLNAQLRGISYVWSATSPSGVTAANDGKLWISDSNSKRIYNVTTTGTLINKFSMAVIDNSASNPTSVSIGQDGTLLIIDSTTDKVYNTTTTGTLLSSFATSDYDSLSTVPTGISSTITESTITMTSKSLPRQQVVELFSNIDTRRLAVTVRHDSSTAKFELYNIAAKAFERAVTFEK